MLINAHDHFNFYKDLESGLNTIEKNKIITLVNSMTFEEYLELKINIQKSPYKNRTGNSSLESR